MTPAANKNGLEGGALEQHLSRQAERSRGFFWNRLRWDLVCQHLPAGERAELVDVGAGPGFLGERLERDFPNLVYRYVEPLPVLEERLEARFGSEANLRGEESFAGARFVTLLDVLEHQADDRLFLHELAQKMNPGSELLMTVPALPSLWSAWDAALGHYRRYEKGSLAAAAAGLPLEPLELSYLFPELLPLAWLRRARMRGDAGGGPTECKAEFPDLPTWMNSALYGLGWRTTRLRARWPAGTSLFARWRRI